MSFFVSDNLKNVITEEDLLEKASEDITLFLSCGEYKEDYFIRSYKKENNLHSFVIEVQHGIKLLFKMNSLNVNHTVCVGEEYFLKGEGILEIKEFSQTLEENLLSCKIVIKQRGVQ